MSRNRGAHFRDRRELLVDIRFLGGAADEGSELCRELALDGRPSVGLDLRRTRGLVEGRLEALRAGVVRGRGNAGAGNADDVGFDHHVVGTADQQQVLDIVPTEQKELPLPVEIVHVDDAEPGLAAAAAIAAAGHHQARARQLAEDHTEEHEQDQDDRESDRKLNGP